MAALFNTGFTASSWQFLRVILGVEGEAMRIAVYCAVAIIALGSALLGLDWLPAPMSPMVDTEAGLRAVAPRVAAPAPAVAPQPTAAPTASFAPKATIGTPIVSPNLVVPRSADVPASSGATAQAVPAEPVAAPAIRCNMNACAAAYQSFRAADCTYQPSNGPRRLCAK